MLSIGDKFPEFNLKGVVSADNNTAFAQFKSADVAGKWQLYFFWPKDFTFVCPTEIAGFGKVHSDFLDRETKVFGISTDSEFVHLAWKQQHNDLTDLPFPMLSDIRRELSNSLGILDEQEGVARRATFLVDPQGFIRFTMVTDLKVGRSPAEILRVLDALQTDELCPCDWQKGDEHINVG